MYLANPIIVLVDNATPTPAEHDITELCSSCELTLTKPQVSGQNTFGVLAQRRELKGLWDTSVSVTFHESYETGGITHILWAMLQDNEPWTMKITALDAPVSATNPCWVLGVSLSEMPAIAGEPGEIAAASVTFEGAGVPTMVTAPES